MRNLKKSFFLVLMLAAGIQSIGAVDFSYKIALKTPGNKAMVYRIHKTDPDLFTRLAIPLKFTEKLEDYSKVS